MEPREDWLDLVRCSDLRQAGAVATSIAAMEYDVRVVDRHGAPVDDGASGPGPFAVQVREADVADLASVLDQIVDEQAQFDASLAARERRALRAWRVLIVAIIAMIVLLAVFGLSKV